MVNFLTSNRLNTTFVSPAFTPPVTLPKKSIFTLIVMFCDHKTSELGVQGCSQDLIDFFCSCHLSCRELGLAESTVHNSMLNSTPFYHQLCICKTLNNKTNETSLMTIFFFF